MIADLKRSSPGRRLGELVNIHEGMVLRPALDAAFTLGARAAMVCTDRNFYSGSLDDLAEVRAYAARWLVRRRLACDEERGE